jgi:hypothetical protein
MGFFDRQARPDRQSWRYALGGRRAVVREGGQKAFNVCFEDWRLTMANTPLRSRFEVGEPLTQLLRRHRTRLDKSQADIARDAWLDESYVSRLFSGERTNPSRDALILLAVFGLGLCLEETDELLMATDYKPLVLPINLR